MKKFVRFLLIPVLLLTVVFVFYKFQANVNSTESSIKFIQEHYSHQGKMIDHFNEIGVKSIEDIKLFVTEKEIKIEFGEIILTWKPDDFISDKNVAALKKIGITMYNDRQTGKLIVLYNGEEITRWVT